MAGSGITLLKLSRVLNRVCKNGEGMQSVLNASSFGELVLEFKSQPFRETHDYLLSEGFACDRGSYFYRPRKMKRTKKR